MKLDDFETLIEVDVEWRHMDASQHVNNVVYLKWVESARIQHFIKKNGGLLKNNGIGPILAWQECKYIRPIVFPDKVMVGIKTVEIKDDRLMTEAHLYSKTDMKLAAISRQMTMAYDYHKKEKTYLPASWKV